MGILFISVFYVFSCGCFCKKIVLFYKLYKFMNIKYIVLLDLFSVLFYSRKVNILYFSMVCLLVKIFLYIFGI